MTWQSDKEKKQKKKYQEKYDFRNFLLEFDNDETIHEDWLQIAEQILKRGIERTVA